MAPGMRAPFTSPGLALLLAGGSPPLPAHVGVCTCLLDVFVLLVGATVSLAQGLPWFWFAERTRSLGKVGDVVWLSRTLCHSLQQQALAMGLRFLIPFN